MKPVKLSLSTQSRLGLTLLMGLAFIVMMSIGDVTPAHGKGQLGWRRTPTITATATPTPATELTPTSTATDPVGEVTPTETPVGEVTPTETPVGEVTPTETPVGEVTPTETPVGEVTPTETPVGEVTPTETPVGEVTPTETPVGEVTPTETPVGEVTPTETPVGEVTPTETPVGEVTPTETPVGEVTPTETPVGEVTPTATPTSVPDGSAILRVVPAEAEIGVAETIATDIEVANVTNFYGVSFNLTFDPNVVQVVDADPAKPGVQIGVGSIFSGADAFVALNGVDNTTGTIHFSAAFRAPATPFGGTGQVAVINWLGQIGGQSDLTLTGTQLATQGGQPIAHSVQNGLIIVKAIPPVVGTILLQGRTDHSGTSVFLVEESCSAAALKTSLTLLEETETPTAITDAAGNFSIQPLPGRTYLCLQAIMHGYLIGQNDAPAGELGTLFMIGGDVTGDNKVDIFDLAFIAGRYRTADPLADINGDGAVDIFDLTIAAGNYRSVGPVTDWN